MNDTAYTKKICEETDGDTVFVASTDVDNFSNKCLSYNNIFADACTSKCNDIYNFMTCETQQVCDDNAPSSIGLVIGIIIAIVGIIVIAILVYCFCCKNKNDDAY